MSFTPTGGQIAILKVGGTTVPGADWKIDADPHLKDCSNFLTGRFRVTTLPDCICTFKLMWDANNQPIDPAGLNIIPGASVTVRAYTDSTHFFTFPGVVGKCTPSLSGLEDIVMMDVEVLLSGGTITLPTVP